MKGNWSDLERNVSCEMDGCKKRFQSKDAMHNHIRNRKNGHGKEICPNCGRPNSRCKDVGGVGAAFACERTPAERRR